VAVVPSIPDLEVTAEALKTLHGRRLPDWSSDSFRELTRPRARFRAEEMLSFCESCGIVAPVQDGWAFTEPGTVLIEALVAGEWSGYGASVLRTGLFDDELTRLIESSAVADGALRCPRVRLRRLAPTVGSLLDWNPEHRVGDELVVPLALLDDVLAISSMEQAADLPEWVEQKHSVGWRAETYSLRRERAQLGVDQVLHISRDGGDGFGYDIETTASEPSRYIEVKGSRGEVLGFVLTRQELSVAEANPESYEIQFWGGISLGRDPAEEFRFVTERGYPMIIPDVAATLEGEGWSKKCQSWRFTGPQTPDFNT
jgi:Domain of unknown function (DUF3883)